MTRRRGFKGYLPDGGILFRLYYEEMGSARSHGKVIKWLVNHGYINPDTGRPPAPQAAWNKMWRWALHKENQQVAYELYNNALRDKGQYMSWEQWKEYLADKALSVLNYNPKHYRDFTEGRY